MPRATWHALIGPFHAPSHLARSHWPSACPGPLGTLSLAQFMPGATWHALIGPVHAPGHLARSHWPSSCPEPLVTLSFGPFHVPNHLAHSASTPSGPKTVNPKAGNTLNPKP
eukprot:1184749-Prorocentrum_minimum.AAC.1